MRDGVRAAALLTAAAPFCSSLSPPPCARPLVPTHRYRASGMVKDEMALISLRQLTGKETTLDQVRDNGRRCPRGQTTQSQRFSFVRSCATSTARD